MKNILNKFNINIFTYLYFLICISCGYIKNALIIFFICLIHEIGHIFFIKIFNYKVISVDIYPFGGYTKVDKMINTSINKDILISLGGIIFQSILYLFTYNYSLFTYYNLIILVFNLLPIIPLDGNKVLNLFLEKKYSYYLSYKLNIFISIIFLIIFITYNYLYNLDNIIIILFLIFKLLDTLKYYKYLYNRFLLERYLYNIEYKHIIYNSNSLKDLKKETRHYFKDKDIYLNEKILLNRLFDKGRIFW